METATELIDTIMTDHYQIDQSKTSAATYIPLRARIERDANQEFRNIFNMRDWTFRYRIVNHTIAAAYGQADFDATLNSDGPNGVVVLMGTTPDQNRRLPYVRAGEFKRLSVTQEHGEPMFYTVTSDIAIYTTRRLMIYPIPDDERIVAFDGHSVTPILVDGDDALTSGIAYLPIDWRDTVLLSKVRAKQMRSKGQLAAYSIEMAAYKEAVFNMICNEPIGQPEAEYMPRYQGAADVDTWFTGNAR